MDDIKRLGRDKISRLMWNMCLQTTSAILLYSAYSLMDTYFVARGVGELAAGAVSVVSPILLLLGAVSTTVGTGAASIVSRALGRKDKDTAAYAVGNAMIIFWAFALINTVTGLIFLNPLLKLLGCTPGMMEYARNYAILIIIGSITSTGFSAVVRAEGATRYSLYMWGIPVCVNLILNPIFIFIFKWGTAGAALGTVLSQISAVVMYLYFFFGKKRSSYNIRLFHFRIKRSVAKEILLVGLPSLILNISITISTIVMNNLLKYFGGDILISAYGIVAKIAALFTMPQTGIVQGMQPIIGYNYGIKSFDRVKEAKNKAIFASISYGCVVFLFILLCKDMIVHLFISDKDMKALAVKILFIVMITLPIKGIPTIIASFYQSVGISKWSILIPVVNILIIEIPILLFGAIVGSIHGLFIAFIVKDVLALLFSFTVFEKTKKSNELRS